MICGKGSCQRHQMCMYMPCLNPARRAADIKVAHEIYREANRKAKNAPPKDCGDLLSYLAKSTPRRET
jgi:hypothetical protein